ncbi:MAG: hypothetical protein KIG78_05980 [Bacteroidaceae bacterium]|nr:hypothetical protein [Bacteroidaceae bacterium]
MQRAAHRCGCAALYAICPYVFENWNVGGISALSTKYYALSERNIMRWVNEM